MSFTSPRRVSCAASGQVVNVPASSRSGHIFSFFIRFALCSEFVGWWLMNGFVSLVDGNRSVGGGCGFVWLAVLSKFVRGQKDDFSWTLILLCLKLILA